MKFARKDEVEKLRNEYPVGTRVELLEMDESQALSTGTKGTVYGVDNFGNILVSWDNGSKSIVVFGVDIIRKEN